MFRHLTDFGHQRSPLEAFGFYLAYLVLGVVTSMVLGMLAGLLLDGFGFESGLTLGTFVAIGICPVLSFFILRAKGLLRHVGFLLVALLSVAGAAVGGLLLGLIFVAFLSNRPSAGSPEPVEAGLTF